jgi:methylisocitrate lyase
LFSNDVDILDPIVYNMLKNDTEAFMTLHSPGKRFREALAVEKPLQIAGTINAYAARLAELSGFRAIYLSGGGVAAASLGLPDLGISTLDDVLVDARRITDITDLPLLVDVDTGFGSAFNIARTVRSLIKVGAGALHIEDQVQAKRCGHRPGKALVPPEEMVDRVKAAVDARDDPDFFILARTDALAVEGLQAALERARAYAEAGADGIFAEAVTDPVIYRDFAKITGLPILANMTEFGKTPLLTTVQLAQHGVDMVLYPLSAFRAMSSAARDVYETIRNEGTQASMLDRMQTRSDLYNVLGYHAYEQKLDELFAKEKSND